MNEPAIDSESLAGLYAAALDALPRSVVVTDQETVLLVNAAAARAFGADSPTDLVGLPVDAMVHPDCHATAALRRQLLASSREELLGLPTKLVRCDGSSVNVVADAHPVEFDGKVAFVFVSGLSVRPERQS